MGADPKTPKAFGHQRISHQKNSAFRRNSRHRQGETGIEKLQFESKSICKMILKQVRQEVQVMTIVEAKKKWGVPPAFNLEFVAYYEDREKRIHSLKSQVSQEKKDFEDLRQQESQVTQTFDQGNKTLQESTQHNDKLRSKVESFRSLLSIGGQEVPKTVAKLTLSKIASPETSSVAIRARSTAYSTGLSSQVVVKLVLNSTEK